MHSLVSSTGTLPCIFLIPGLFFIPESPRWLAKMGFMEDCETSLQVLRGFDTDISAEFNEIKIGEDIEIEVSRRGSELVDTVKNEQSIERKHTEELRLSNDVEEMKSKLRELESILRRDNKLRTKRNTEPRAQIGYQLVVVFVVAIVSLYLGYLLHG